jgi:hypothetical protein
MDRFSRILIDQKSTSASAEKRIKQLMASYNRTRKSSKPSKTISTRSKIYLRIVTEPNPALNFLVLATALKLVILKTVIKFITLTNERKVES